MQRLEPPVRANRTSQPSLYYAFPTRCHYYAQAEWKDRRQLLQRLLAKACGDVLLLVDVFDDDPALLRAAADQGFEGIVSKHREAPYRSGHTDARIKVKVEGWIEANRQRL